MCASVKCYIRACLLKKVGLIISKKRQQLTADNMDGISFLGCHYKDNGWGKSAKRPRCVPEVEGERFEAENQMAA